MKYLLMTISILFVLVIIITGVLFYSSYALWLNNREEVLSRLYTLRRLVEEGQRSPVSLTPSLRAGKNTVIYDRQGRIIGEFSDGRRRILPLNRIPPLLIHSVILMEDRKFFIHRGFDLRRIAGAMLVNVKTLSFSQGGSTVTQQLAKILFTDSRKTVRRKIYELFCTIEIERRFSKEEILSLYLNSINFGHSNYGIESASQFYFNKEIFNLNSYEISLLVGMIPSPSRFSPLLHPERCKRKQMIVLNYLSQYEFVKPEPLLDGLDTFWESFAQIEHQPAISFWSMESNRAPYFVEYVRQYLVRELGEETVKAGGLGVYTTLDLEKQLIADIVLEEGLDLQRAKEDEVDDELQAPVEGALIALEPGSGAILAMVGGSGFTFENQFNRSTSALRQVGSAFKPFVYASAFESEGYSAETVFNDEPLRIETPQGEWRPANYGDQYYGPVPLSFALQKSLNSVAVQLLQHTGPEPVIDLIGRALDLSRQQVDERFKPYLSIALGVYSFSPLEFARAYSIFPNGGEMVFPYAVTRVKNNRGVVLIDNERDVKKIVTEYDLEGKLRVIGPDTAQQINDMLLLVTKRGGTAYRAIQSSGLTVEAAGKTGTTNNYTDAWFIGYTEEILAAVWVGYDDPAYTLGVGQSGGVVAATIWTEFIKRALWREE
jgi:1A family penicillin-binding protein